LANVEEGYDDAACHTQHMRDACCFLSVPIVPGCDALKQCRLLYYSLGSIEEVTGILGQTRYGLTEYCRIEAV
jgi:hypothetical protein